MTLTAASPLALAAAAEEKDVLERAVAARAARRSAEVAELVAAVEWAHLHPASLVEDAVSWAEGALLWGEKRVEIAGAGAPWVAEFAPWEYAAAVGMSPDAGLALIGDALDLFHRLPLLFELVQALRVPVWLARLAAAESRDLSAEAATHADRLLTWQPSRLNPHRVKMLVQEARLYADPDRAGADHDEALAARRVEVHHGEGAPGTSKVDMLLDTADAVAFDTTISSMAATMSALGHHGSLDVRRAHSVGVLADPQRALDLLAVDPADPDRPDPESDPAVCVAEEITYAPADPFRGQRSAEQGTAGRGKNDAMLVVHVTDTDLLDSGPFGRGGVARTRLGPIMLDRLAGWLMNANVTVRPVLDHRVLGSVDRHDPPTDLAEAVQRRDETCVFPSCTRTSAQADLDHIEAYVSPDEGGPPGQTSQANLAPLCRRHHRAKTFGDFSYSRESDASYRWVLPTGRVVITDPPRPRPRPARSRPVPLR